MKDRTAPTKQTEVKYQYFNRVINGDIKDPGIALCQKIIKELEIGDYLEAPGLEG